MSKSRLSVLKKIAAGSHDEKPANNGESGLSLAGGTVGRLSLMAQLLREHRGRLISTIVDGRAA
jgi:hypothetical protein